jgi:hypothetical protein
MCHAKVFIRLGRRLSAALNLASLASKQAKQDARKTGIALGWGRP